MKPVAVASALLAAMTVMSANAQDEANASSDISGANAAITERFYFSPMGSYTWEDKKRDTDEGFGGALTIGKQFSRWFSAELSAFYSEFHVSAVEQEMEMIGYGVNALVFPFSSGMASNIFGLVGVHGGQGNSHPTVGIGGADDYDTVLADAGLGFLYGPFAWLNHGSLRVEARYRMDFHDEPGLGAGNEDEFGDVVANVGLLIPIGAQAEPPPPPAPAPVEVVPVAAPVDSDGDGVPDDLDQCPGTPAGEPVNEVGCPLPKCKTPEPGQPVTLEGCAAGDKIVLRGVNFEFDKSRLTANARTILDGVGDALTTAPTVTVEIGGHTDAKGTDEYNQKLSERRAQSVVQYLVGKGIDSGRMTSVGYGESQPVADNETDEGRELNRRVELKITGGATEVAAPAAAAPAAEAAPAADAAAPAADAAAPAAAEAPAADAPTAEAPAP